MILVTACVLSAPIFALALYCLWTGPTVEQMRARAKGGAEQREEQK